MKKNDLTVNQIVPFGLTMRVAVVLLFATVISATAETGCKLEAQETGKGSGETIVDTRAQQQKNRITGTVTDVAGIPVIGANVIEKGTSNGTVTDIDGNFAIEVENNAIIQITYMGYLPQDLSTAGATELTITLVEDTQSLDELVVVGYGTQKKVNLTGAVSQITSKDMEDRPVSNMSQILQGAIPNLNVHFSTGQPGVGGTLNVRGTTSINGGGPLVLVDGVPGDINRINPYDVESVSVLKDAAASAIYGARGAFGVILVTTRNAKEGKMSITYNNNFGWASPTVSTDFLTNGYEHVMLNDEAFLRSTGNTYTRY